MVKVLIADSNLDEVTSYSQYLSNYDNTLEAIGSNTGIDTLSKYNEMKADILILNSGFKDIKSTEIVDRLSNTVYERSNNNIILTMNSKNEVFKFNNTAKIYRIFQKPFDMQKLADTVVEIKDGCKNDALDEDYLNKLLFSMRITIGSYQTEILKEAIREAYTYPALLDNFDAVLSILAFKHNNVTPENIRNAIRNSLYNLNKYRDKFQTHPVVKMFELDRNISPKNFLEAVVSYLHVQKSKQN